MTTPPAALVFDTFEAAADCVDELTTPATAGQFLISESESGVYRVYLLDSDDLCQTALDNPKPAGQ